MEVKRSVCDGCGRPPIVCYCDLLPSPRLAPGVRILCVQHPNEAKRKALSSVPLLQHSLEDFTVDVTEMATLASVPGRRRVLLFPGPTAEMLAPSAETEALELVVVDGTWKEAKRLVNNSPDLQALPRVLIACSASSLYGSLRNEPKDGYVSTLEAVAQAITVLRHGDNRIQLRLLSLFGEVVARQTAFADAGRRANEAFYDGVPKPDRSRTPARAVAPATDDGDCREYIFYTVTTGFDGREAWAQHGPAFVSSYSHAMRLCVERNEGRKRGERFGVVLKETFARRTAEDEA
ncbi:hypothetical protein ACHHYP_00982 [Achlya hypogyna]|uniref:tRNA-uridine aminocarboxypropyltransferase n=1 Tax=Achlya hypogyna TaxID=1202772 RepID=A0A1V9Z9L5_ACHHY|nr:hypothetical protein ACHHYP_00982 [Achlya hypogyna]